MLSLCVRVGLVSLVLISLSPVAGARTRTHGLVHPRVCLAGHWGKPVKEWRVQLAVFDDERKAVAYKRRLAKSKILSEYYIAMWRQRGDKEPMAVVSRAVFKNAKAARRAALKIRKAGFRAFARHYTRYRR